MRRLRGSTEHHCEETRITRTLWIQAAAILTLALSSNQALSQTATPAATTMVFNPASVGVSAGSAQTLTASFLVSGYSGTFTPTAKLHYGLSYTAAAVNCTGGSSPETCTVAITFQPQYPGGRREGCQGRSKSRPVRRSKSRPVDGDGVGLYFGGEGALERSRRGPSPPRCS